MIGISVGASTGVIGAFPLIGGTGASMGVPGSSVGGLALVAAASALRRFSCGNIHRCVSGVGIRRQRSFLGIHIIGRHHG